MKEQIKSLLERIRGVRNSRDLEVYQRVMPGIKNEQKKLIEEIKENEQKEKRLREEQRVKQHIFKRGKAALKEKAETLRKALKTYLRLTPGMAEEDNRQNEPDLESLFYDMEEAKDIDALRSIGLAVEEQTKDMISWRMKMRKLREKAKGEKKVKEKR